MNTKDLIEQVKYNCNVSDAKFWGYFSICGLLLRLRELYRQEMGLMPWERISTKEIAPWIEEREKLWKELENKDFNPITIDGKTFEVFEIEKINGLLNKKGLIYGGGYGIYGKPTFFLSILKEKKEVYDYPVYYIGKELCRDLSTSIAMLQGVCIFLRKEQLINSLWEKVQETKTKTVDDLNRMLYIYFSEQEMKKSQALYEKISLISEAISDIFVYHEIGEAVEDRYSFQWIDIIGKDKWLEIYLRGLKDLIADTSDYGPLRLIIQKQDKKLLFFYILFQDNIRKSLFPEIKKFLQINNWNLFEEIRISRYKAIESVLKNISELIISKDFSSVKRLINDYLEKSK